jgi:ABC-type methionine transport system ATPase subunit
VSADTLEVTMKKVKVELTFPSALKDEPIFYHMCRNFDVIPNIIEASFSTDNGWAYVMLEGQPDDLDRVLEYLRSKHIIVDMR